jgi:pimeloyl-ACP methyl ester carboxylesterase
MSHEVTRHFATLAGRQIHYRRVGKGAPVLLLHQTPTSSAELLPLMRHLASRFTVIAPDMPGYGASDRLGSVRIIGPSQEVVAATLTIDALADDLALFMSTIQINAAGIYGFHTGASVATALARRHPTRVAVAIAEGLLCLDSSERDELIARYLEPFVPRWDGSHLSWLWTRLKDQSVFFPWYERSAHGRLAIDAASSGALAAKAQDWLRSGEQYHEAYRAAMIYDPRTDLTHITTPHFVIASGGDPLARHIERLPSLPPNVQVETAADSSVAMARIGAIFGAHCGGLKVPPSSATSPIEGGNWQEYVGSPGAQRRVCRAGDAHAQPLLVQHDAQSSASSCVALLSGFAPTRAVYSVDLPGHGLSDVASAEPDPTIEQLAEQVRVAVTAYGVDVCDHIGIGAGAAIVVELERAMKRARQRSRTAQVRCGSLTLIAPIDLSGNAELSQALAASYVHAPIDPYGGYLLKAWHEVRDHQLFFPWFERRRAYGISGTPMLAPDWLQEQTATHVVSGASGVALRRREAHYPFLDRLRGCDNPARFAAPDNSPRCSHTQILAGSSSAWATLGGSMSGWAASLTAAVASNRSGSDFGHTPRSDAS